MEETTGRAEARKPKTKVAQAQARTSAEEELGRTNAWIRKRFPGAIEEAGSEFFTLTKGGDIAITNDWVVAYLIGGWGMPQAPTVYCRATGNHFRYDPRETVYRDIEPAEVVQQAVRVIKACAKDTGAGRLHSLLKGQQFKWLPGVLAGLAEDQPLGLGSPLDKHSVGSIQVENGVLDLATLNLSSPDPTNAGLWRIPIPWMPEASSPERFLRFLRELMPHPDDRELLLDLLASAFVGNPCQKLLILRGTGGSGKSTLIDLLGLLLGNDASGELGLEDVKYRFTAINWAGKLLLVESEASQDAINGAYSQLKRISGHDKIFAGKKNEGHHQFVCRALPVLVSNEHLTIRVRGDEAAWERRAVILDAADAPPDREVVLELHQRLVELEGPEILKLLISRAAAMLSGEKAVRPLTPAQLRRVTAHFSYHAYLKRWAQQRLTTQDRTRHLYRDEAWADFQQWAEAKGYATGPTVAPTTELRQAVESVGGVWSQSLPEPADREKAGILALKGWRGVALKD